MHRVFLAHDHDRDGAVDSRELQSALFALGLQASPLSLLPLPWPPRPHPPLAVGLQADGRQARAIVRRFDFDASGALQLAEFRTLVAELRAFQASGGERAGGGPPAERRAGRDEVLAPYTESSSSRPAAPLPYSTALLHCPLSAAERAPC